MEMEIDRTLIHEAQKFATGQNAHELNRLRGMYERAAERRDVTSFVMHGDLLRRYITVIKRRAFAAATCQHANMQRVKASGWTWLCCDECGHTADEKKV